MTVTPTVPQQLMFTTFRIETETSIGTGFTYAHMDQDGESRHYLVTNKHVVQETRQGEITFTESDKRTGLDVPLVGQPVPLRVQDEAWAWTYHPSPEVDVAVMRLGHIVSHITQRGKNVYFTGISAKWLAGEQQLRELDALDPVIFVGYPVGIYDQANNLPVIRTGTIATLPHVDYNGRPEFLIDASVFPGSSGSPVFIYNKPPWLSKYGELMNRERLLFLGLIKAVHIYSGTSPVQEEVPAAARRQFVTTDHMIGLGIVQKAAGVVETVQHLLDNEN